MARCMVVFLVTYLFVSGVSSTLLLLLKLLIIDGVVDAGDG